MTVVRKCAVLRPFLPNSDETTVERIGYGNEFYSPYVRHLNSYDGKVKEGMFYSTKHDAFADTIEELRRLK